MSREIKYTFIVTAADIKRAQLECQLQTLADKIGARFEPSYVKKIKKELKRGILNFKNDLKWQTRGSGEQ